MADLRGAARARAAGSAVALYICPTPASRGWRALGAAPGSRREELDQAGNRPAWPRWPRQLPAHHRPPHANRLDFYGRPRPTSRPRLALLSTNGPRASWRARSPTARSATTKTSRSCRRRRRPLSAGQHRHVPAPNPPGSKSPRVAITADRAARRGVVVTKVARRHLRCLDRRHRRALATSTPAPRYVGAERPLRLYAISHAATPAIAAWTSRPWSG